LACFISGIGGRLAPAAREFKIAIETADASDFDLEQVDEIRYGIRSAVWEREAISLIGFVEILGKQASAERGLPRVE
jgi:hypothetical protein